MPRAHTPAQEKLSRKREHACTGRDKFCSPPTPHTCTSSLLANALEREGERERVPGHATRYPSIWRGRKVVSRLQRNATQRNETTRNETNRIHNATQRNNATQCNATQRTLHGHHRVRPDNNNDDDDDKTNERTTKDERTNDERTTTDSTQKPATE